MITRREYMDNPSITHREYYGQFVTDHIKQYVRKNIGVSRLLKSEDEHMNDIPLGIWDALPHTLYIGNKFKEAGDFSTAAGYVCLYKEAARQIVEQTNLTNSPTGQEQ